MHAPDGADGETNQLSSSYAQQSRGSFRTQALLKSALALIKNNGCRREEEGEKNRNKSPLDLRQTSSAVLANCHLTCRELSYSGEQGEKQEGQDKLPNCFYPRTCCCPAVPGRVQICSARNLHGRHSGFLLCRSKGECKHSFLPEGILVQAERGKEKRGREGRARAQHRIQAKEEKQ